MARKSKPARFPNMVMQVRFIEPSGREGYAHVRAFIVTRTPGGNPKSTQHLYGYDTDNGGKFAEVQIHSQTDHDHLVNHGTREPMYGYGLEWGSSKHGLSEAKAAVAGLGEVERKLDAMTEEYGVPASFGVYVMRVAKAIGLDQVDFNGKDYLSSPDDAARTIDYKINDWVANARKVRGLEAA